MSSWLLWIAFAVTQAALVLSCVLTKAPAIEADLRRKAEQALEAQGVDLGDGLLVDGRDAWLSGVVDSEDSKARAAEALAHVSGLRAVHDLLKTGGRAIAPPVDPPAHEATAKASIPEPVAEIAKPASGPAMPGGGAAHGEAQRSIDDVVAGRVVEFAPGSARLTANGAALVDELAGVLQRYPGVGFEIGGHTDSQGTSRNNLEMSRRRAEAVRTRLVEAGVSAGRLTAKGYGEDRPVADNRTRAGREKNRRVELTVQ